MNILRSLFVVLLAAWMVCAPAQAALERGPVGELCTSQVETAPFVCDDTITVDGAKRLYIEFVFEVTTATLQLQQKLAGGTNFTDVGAAVTANAIQSVEDPAGTYRINATACTTCTITVNYHAVYRR